MPTTPQPDAAKMTPTAPFVDLLTQFGNRQYECGAATLQPIAHYELAFNRAETARKALLDAHARLLAENAQKDEEIAKLRKALEFYAGRPRADGNGYEISREGFRGDAARAALSSKEGQKAKDGGGVNPRTKKPRVICRFCRREMAVRAGSHLQYKPTFLPHKCEHGAPCIGGRPDSKGFNWAAIYIGNPAKLVRGCPECYADQQRRCVDARAKSVPPASAAQEGGAK